MKIELWKIEFKERGIELAAALDSFGNFLNRNRPKEIDAVITVTFLESLKAIGESLIEYGKAVKMAYE